jgi:hypothetical protein
MIQNRQFKEELTELHGCIYAFLDHSAGLAQIFYVGVKISLDFLISILRAAIDGSAQPNAVAQREHGRVSILRLRICWLPQR